MTQGDAEAPKTSTGKNRKYALRAMAKTTGPD